MSTHLFICLWKNTAVGIASFVTEDLLKKSIHLKTSDQLAFKKLYL